jgi:Fis family transcriptional regulator, factor for inversion stimulation protein
MSALASIQGSQEVSQLGQLAPRERRKEPLRASVHSALERFFRDLDGHDAEGVYDMVIGQVEQAMLESIMHHTRSNQTRAAEVLGINRSTLRKKLKQYGLL